MYKLPSLPYQYSALEPYIDAKTMFVHYNKHFKTYLDNLNTRVKEESIPPQPIESLIRNTSFYSEDVRNNGGGYYNHLLFWKMLSPVNEMGSNKPPMLVESIIKRDFGSLTAFKKEIIAQAKKRFGSGWVWWVMLPSGKTEIINTANQDNPQMFLPCEILLGIDVWEHAYYLKYQSERAEYVKNIFNVINWYYPNKILSTYYKK
jgi:Fe-Mn family superoxide dismutase